MGDVDVESEARKWLRKTQASGTIPNMYGQYHVVALLAEIERLRALLNRLGAEYDDRAAEIERLRKELEAFRFHTDLDSLNSEIERLRGHVYCPECGDMKDGVGYRLCILCDEWEASDDT